MTVQTAYDINTANAVAGQLADIGFNEIDSKQAEGVVPFGVIVSRGTNDGQAAVGIGSGAGQELGVSVRDLAREGAANTGAVQYEDKDTLAVMRLGSGGQIYVAIPSGGSAGDAIKFTDTTGVIDAGAVGAGETLIAGATLEEDVAAGKIGKIRLG